MVPGNEHRLVLTVLSRTDHRSGACDPLLEVEFGTVPGTRSRGIGCG